MFLQVKICLHGVFCNIYQMLSSFVMQNMTLFGENLYIFSKMSFYPKYFVI